MLPSAIAEHATPRLRWKKGHLVPVTLTPHHGEALSHLNVERYQRLSDEYDDLMEEYEDCGDQDERRRCAARMDSVASEIRENVLPVPATEQRVRPEQAHRAERAEISH
jgi:hypothetical protein